MSVWYACVYVFMHVHMHVEAQCDIMCVPQSLSALSDEAGSLIEPEAHRFWLVWLDVMPQGVPGSPS